MHHRTTSQQTDRTHDNPFFSRLIALNTSIENLTVRDPTTNLSTKQPTET
jgi:hypothetical protein